MATFAVVQYQTSAKLRAQLEELRQQNLELAQVREENQLLRSRVVDPHELERLRKGEFELVRLRGQVTSLRTVEAELVKLQAENHQLKSLAQKEPANADTAKTPVAVRINGPRVPASAWANVGFASPTAAFQTLNWAIANRDSNALASALIWADEQARAQAEATFAATPEAFRTRYGSLEGFLYSNLMDTANAAGYSIIAQVDRGDRSTVAVQKDFADGGTRNERVQFQLDGGSYKQVVQPGIADKMIQDELANIAKGRP